MNLKDKLPDLSLESIKAYLVDGFTILFLGNLLALVVILPLQYFFTPSEQPLVLMIPLVIVETAAISTGIGIVAYSLLVEED